MSALRPRSLAIAACLCLLAAPEAFAAAPAADPAEPKHGDHDHGVGAHGGLIVPLGRDSYHVEPVFESGGILRLYLLGSDETRIQETQRQTLTAYVKPAGGSETVALQFESDPQEGDADDKTSRFKGVIPEPLRGMAVDITIPNLRIEKERFRVGFTSAPPPDHAAAMPAALADDESTKLFLTPGGTYTEADIVANGRLTAQQKFKGFQAKHDVNPKPGDRLCPISETKANPLCAWVIGGKTYEFCCPPCVEEFVRTAKEKPDEIKDPEAYVKR
jgi:YHS domain-containing protein